MSGISDLLGRNGVLEQLVLWNVIGQAMTALMAPAFQQLQQDVSAKHPGTALDAGTLADALTRGLVTEARAKAEAAETGIDGERFDIIAGLHKVRLPPADLATAVLRDYLTAAQAEAEAAPQGVDAATLATMTSLAGDAPGPQDAARALLRGIIPEAGAGPGAVSFEQAIREGRLHDKWTAMMKQLAEQLLSPADAASAVVRNFIAADQGVRLAGQQGIDAATFQTLIRLSGDAPGPQQLAEALRRGLIAETGTGAESTSFQQGIAEGRLADKWTDVIKGLAQLWPTPVDVLDAQVKGQLTPDVADELYTRLGGDPQFKSWLLSSAGSSPTPLEAAVMAARGIIPEAGTGPDVTSYAQAVRESRYRDKWSAAYRELSRFFPTSSEVITFLAHGAITSARATKLLQQHDMDAEMTAAFLDEAQITALSDYRGLTQSSVLQMYYGHMLDQATATSILETLHVDPKAAALLLAYTDMRQVIDTITTTVARIGALYTARKISADTASQALARLEIPAGEIQRVIANWEITASANVRTLTQAEIVDAWYYGNLTADEAMTDLQAIGYTPYDAWVLVSNKAKGPLPGKPVRTVAPPQGAVIPGVT